MDGWICLGADAADAEVFRAGWLLHGEGRRCRVPNYAPAYCPALAAAIVSAIQKVNCAEGGLHIVDQETPWPSAGEARSPNRSRILRDSLQEPCPRFRPRSGLEGGVIEHVWTLGAVETGLGRHVEDVIAFCMHTLQQHLRATDSVFEIESLSGR